MKDDAMTIKRLFDPSKDIYRTIEKVITYSASQEERLRAEIREYVVTDNIEEQFEQLLTKMQLAMEQGGQNEVGVWVSGFYGSGKSSFTKYLGLALDDSVQVDGIRFLRHLQDRMKRPQTRALLNTVAGRYATAVVLLDLASEMLAGATMEDVSTVLYFKVLQWAGYSRNLKVAALERRLQKDGRQQEFHTRIQQALGVSWADVQNDPLVIDSLLPEIAHDLYPNLFKTPSAFSTETGDFVRFETDRVQEMLEIVREVSGKEYVLFVIDEVGQYVGSRPNLILNLDGLAKNLKNIGDGKVWIMGTAQQTLTEDDPRAALNSPELYKLTARFPIQIDLESSDIKEICTARLLGKSAEGAQILGDLFDKHGQALRHHTKLEDARYYDADFDRQTFIDLYPFLPAHFDILLHLLGALAKSTSGIGLRSAIKLIQDILVEGTDGDSPVADWPVGRLATTVTLYDALEKDIRRAFSSIHSALHKAQLRFNDPVAHRLHQEVAKSVAVLQILANMPVTVQNVCSLMQPAVDSPSQREAVDAAVQDLIEDTIVPFGEKDGQLVFFSEKVNEIDQERSQLHLRVMDTQRIQNEALRDAFSPLPATRLYNSLTVSAGLRVAAGSQIASLAGERETVQITVEFADAADYATVRTRLQEESRQRSAQHTIFLLGRTDPEVERLVGEIYRSQEIARRFRNDPDSDVRDYCTAQSDRAARLTRDLQHRLRRSLAQGSFLFRGQITAVESLDGDLLAAARSYLANVAAQVFDRYVEAPVRAEATLAEKFLRAPLTAMTANLDPLSLVQVSGGKPFVKTDGRAAVSILDYLNRHGKVEGKRLSDHFTSAPFGWSPDTLRYLVAALLMAGEVSIWVSGREVTVKGQQAIESLRTNNAFRSVGLSLRDGRPPMEMLARSAQRLTELVGEMVVPLEEEISKAAAKHFPQYQYRFGPLAEKMESLGLPGVEAVRSLLAELADAMLADASDAPQRLGGEESALYESLRWAGEVDLALKNGLEATIKNLRYHLAEIDGLPDTGIPGQLRRDLAEEMASVRERLRQNTFYKHAPDLGSALTAIQARTQDAARRLVQAQSRTIEEAQADLQRLPAWSRLTPEEQQESLGQLESLTCQASHDIQGIRSLLTQEYVISQQVSELKRKIHQLGQRREPEPPPKVIPGKEPGLDYRERLAWPAAVTSLDQLDGLIERLQTLRQKLGQRYAQIEITFDSEE